MALFQAFRRTDLPENLEPFYPSIRMPRSELNTGEPPEQLPGVLATPLTQQGGIAASVPVATPQRTMRPESTRLQPTLETAVSLTQQAAISAFTDRSVPVVTPQRTKLIQPTLQGPIRPYLIYPADAQGVTVGQEETIDGRRYAVTGSWILSDENRFHSNVQQSLGQVSDTVYPLEIINSSSPLSEWRQAGRNLDPLLEKAGVKTRDNEVAVAFIRGIGSLAQGGGGIAVVGDDGIEAMAGYPEPNAGTILFAAGGPHAPSQESLMMGLPAHETFHGLGAEHTERWDDKNLSRFETVMGPWWQNEGPSPASPQIPPAPSGPPVWTEISRQMDPSLVRALDAFWGGDDDVRFTPDQIAQLREIHRRSGSQESYFIWVQDLLKSWRNNSTGSQDRELIGAGAR